MKRLPKIIGLCLMTVCLLGSAVYAETVQISGNYYTPGIVDGDLVITNGSVIINGAGDLVINGDLKINGGSIFMGPVAGKLKVQGDLIVTNTRPSGDASVIIHDDIEVAGAIITRSSFGDADVTTTGTTTGYGKIQAENIITRGYSKANIYARDLINVISEIDTKSTSNTAFVDSVESTIYAGSVVTDAYGDGYCQAVSLTVIRELSTKSTNGDAYVRSKTSLGDIIAGSLQTNGYGNAYVQSHGDILVMGDIIAYSSNGDAYVYAMNDSIRANNIVTKALVDGKGAYVNAQDYIDVKGDIVTNSHGTSYVSTFQQSIKAYSVKTEGKSSAYVSGDDGIEVVADIVTKSTDSGSAYVYSANGDIKSGEITTQANTGSACVLTVNGSIDVNGSIKTKSTSSSANVESGGYVKSEHIFTQALGSGSAYVYAQGGDVDVKGLIKTNSSSGQAEITADANIKAQGIKTSGSQGYVAATSGSIIVDVDITTNASTGSAYVQALNGNISAQKIKTQAVAGQDDSIKSAAGSGCFKLSPNTSDAALTIKDAEFSFDSDQVWNTQLTLDGTCTINGNGHELLFDSNGGIIVSSGASVLLKNVHIDNVWGEVIKCADNTATLSLHSVIWTQTSDTAFKNGTIQFVGDCCIEGPNTIFSYESSLTSTIHNNATLLFDHKVTVSYDTTMQNGFGMMGSTSRLNFNGATLYAAKDCRFITGCLVFDHVVTCSAEEGKTIYFGNGSVPNNVTLELHPIAYLEKHGTIVNANA